MRSHSPITAYIGLGANLGDRSAHLQGAIHKLGQTDGVELLKVSQFLETAAVGGPPGSPSFLNAALEISTTLGSHALLHRLLEIEKEIGRVRRDKWEPRVIDLDVLLYGDKIISSDELVVPHPLMQERRFVLEPLAAIAPEAVHPALQMTIAGLLQNVKVGGEESTPPPQRISLPFPSRLI